MDYDSAGITYTFESAGMLDIKAYQGESPLQLAENKTIDFQFNSTSSENDFNFYSLNKETGEWAIENQAINVIKKDNDDEVQPKITKHKSSKKIEEPTAPVKQNKAKYSLNLAVNKKNYPELEKYEGIIFEINEKNKKFDPIIYKIQWEDASLSDSKIKDNYTLQIT